MWIAGAETGLGTFQEGITVRGGLGQKTGFATGSVGAAMVLEPKPGMPTDPDNRRAFIDVFTYLSGSFVINDESG